MRPRTDRENYALQLHTTMILIHYAVLVCLAYISTAALLHPSNVSKIAFLKILRRRVAKPDDVNGVRPHGAATSPGPYLPPPGPPPSSGESFQVTHDGHVYNEQQLRYLISEVKDYQLTHGSVLKGVGFETESSVTGRTVGVSILPTPVPRRRFEEAIALQQSYNNLYMRVASDPDWLYSALKPLANHDPFFNVLWEVFEKVKEADAVQKVVCAVFRNDYMLHQANGQGESVLKQVEMNTFSCAGFAHAQRISNMHRHLAKVRSANPDTVSSETRLPPCENVKAIVDMLLAASKMYASRASSTRPKCILMTVQPFNFNVVDERPVEIGLWEHSIPCYRVEWATVSQRTTLTDDRTLLFRPPFGETELEVSVIYYRGGYIIEEYKAEGKALRIKLEISKAIKVPDILTHLAGFKTVQQALTRPGAVERFLPADAAQKIRETFMLPMQVLDTSPTGLKARKTALDPQACLNYVLKPNRDGGGHNVYRSDIPQFLRTKSEANWVQYILMRLIQPPSTNGTLMMPEDLYNGVSPAAILRVIHLF
jgi:glutathione synthase